MTSLKGLSRIIVYGAEYCSFCQRAKFLLEQSKSKFTYYDVEEDNKMDELLQLQGKYNYRTIPMIIVDGKFIGGYSELYKMVNSK